jgi:hydroxypyruvate reductase
MTVFDPASLSPAAGRQCLRGLFDAALQAVDPLQSVPRHLPPRPRGRTVVVGAGKAAARMALALEQFWDGPLSGLVVTRYGHGEPCRHIEVVEAGHPMPDDAGLQAAQRIRTMVEGLGADDLVIALVSGGGKLGDACGAASVWTLVLSDVPGDDPRTVASGPTLADDSTPADALAVLQRHGITPPASVLRLLQAAPVARARQALGPRECRVIATAQGALEAAAAAAQAQGLRTLILGNALEGEARHVGMVHAGLARQVASQGQPAPAPLVLLSGGETTVTVTGQGRGGRNAEFLLGAQIGVADLGRVWGLAADTDGIDGSESNAGAVFGPDSWARGQALGLSPRELLGRNDAYSWFEALGDLVETGPTRTNVNDFRALLIA